MEIVQKLMAPLILLPLMFVVGLQLTPADFRRVLEAPRAVVGGTLGQLVLLPLMTWIIVTVFGISPILAAGAVLLAATPGAGMSNVMAAVAGANVALSVTLTAVASLLAVVSMPLMAALGLSLFIDGDAEVSIPLSALFRQLVLFLAIPLGLGMLARARWPETALRYVSPANRFAVLAILVLTPFSAYMSRDMIPPGSEFLTALGIGLVWTLAAISIGWGVATLLGLENNDRFTFLIEFSARNIAMTFIVAAGSLGRIDLALFAVAYSMTGFPLVIMLSIYRGRRQRAQESAASEVRFESGEIPSD
jgi:BASS family bile acid:Na+ symporter